MIFFLSYLIWKYEIYSVQDWSTEVNFELLAPLASSVAFRPLITEPSNVLFLDNIHAFSSLKANNPILAHFSQA